MKKVFLALPLALIAGCATTVPDDTTFSDPVAIDAALTADTDVTEPAGDPNFLGFTVASLGDASRPGLWLETPLVEEEGPGNVISESGMILDVILIPLDAERGSGSRLSLEGFQTLGIPLTELPTLTVNAIVGA